MWLTTPNRSKLWYFRVGKTSKIAPGSQVYILLHGLGGDAFGLEPLAQSIIQRDPDAIVDVYDLRGHGYSSKLFSNTSSTIWEAYAKDVATILHNNNYAHSSICVIGHSLGGIILKEFLSKNPTFQKRNRYSWVTITTPQYTHKLPLFLGTPTFWYKWLCWYTAHHNNHQKHRTSQYHLYYKNSHDYWLPRIWSDAKWTGKILWLLLFLSSFGWSLTNQDRLTYTNSTNIFSLYGNRDLIVPFHIHSYMDYAKKVTITGNHIIVFSAFTKLADHITRFTHKDQQIPL